MTKSAITSVAFAALSFIVLATHPAYAGENTARAESYFTAITSRDVQAISSFYADDAEFRWVGGPLAGTYKGKDKIRAVWDKFAREAGNFTHEVLEISENADSKGSNVTARVKFKGDTEVAVKFLLAFKDGKITGETWQVDRSAPVVAKTEPRPATPQPASTLAAQPETVAKAEPEGARPPEQALTMETANPKASESDYLPKGATAPSKERSKTAAPSESKPAAKPKAADGKSADSRKPGKRYRNDGRYEGEAEPDDYENYRSSYGYRRYYRSYDYDRYPGYGGYRRYWGFGFGGGFGGGYGRYYGGY